MISEERLRELIDNEKEVWIVANDSSMSRTILTSRYGVSVDEYNKANNCEPMLYSNFCGCGIFTDICPISQAFETEDEAREYLKYGNVTRTEKFPYVSWEEIDKDFQNLANGTYTIAEDKYKFSLNIKVNKPFVSQILLVTEEANFNWNYSRENYHKALDLAIRLWKGEE